MIQTCRDLLDLIDKLRLDVTWKEDHRVIRALEFELCSYPEVSAGREMAKAEQGFWDMNESQLVAAFNSLVDRMGEVGVDDLPLALNLWGMGWFVGLLCPKETRGTGGTEVGVWQNRSRACQETLARFAAIYVKLYAEKKKEYRASDKYLGTLRPKTVLKREFCAVCPSGGNCPERGKIAAM